MSEALFIKASREQFRFATRRGVVATEDLWTLSLEDLDTMAIALSAKITAETASFLKGPKKNKSEDAHKLEIIKFVIETRQTEAEAKKDRAMKAKRVQTLKAALAERSESELKSKTSEELQALIDEAEKEVQEA